METNGWGGERGTVTNTPFGRLCFVEIIGDIATADKPTAFVACDEVTLYAIAYNFMSCISECLRATVFQFKQQTWWIWKEGYKEMSIHYEIVM